jgi:hypothetical protein
MPIKEFDKYHRKILRDLFYDRRIGGRHTSEDNITKGFPKSDRGFVKDALKDLIKENLVIPKKSTGEIHVYLNPDRIVDIKKIIEQS